MNNEPSNTLGRLVAAERNALASIQTAKQAVKENGELKARIAKLEASQIQLEQRLSAMQGQIAGAMGTGATSR